MVAMKKFLMLFGVIGLLGGAASEQTSARPAYALDLTCHTLTEGQKVTMQGMVSDIGEYVVRGQNVFVFRLSDVCGTITVISESEPCHNGYNTAVIGTVVREFNRLVVRADKVTC